MQKQLRKIVRHGHLFQAHVSYGKEDLARAALASRRDRRVTNSGVPIRQRRSAWLSMVNARAAQIRKEQAA